MGTLAGNCYEGGASWTRLLPFQEKAEELTGTLLFKDRAQISSPAHVEKVLAQIWPCGHSGPCQTQSTKKETALIKQNRSTLLREKLRQVPGSRPCYSICSIPSPATFRQLSSVALYLFLHLFCKDKQAWVHFISPSFLQKYMNSFVLAYCISYFLAIAE